MLEASSNTDCLVLVITVDRSYLKIWSSPKCCWWYRNIPRVICCEGQAMIASLMKAIIVMG